jgi:nitrite reductase (NADH) small subunit
MTLDSRIEHTWTKITRFENIPPREGRPVRVGNLEIAIFNLNGRFLTIENACPHKGGPLCDGIVTGAAVVCPLHGRHFDLETGMPVRASEPSCLAIFPTRVEDGIILVNLEACHKAFDSEAAA